MSSFWPEEAELRAIPNDEPTAEADYLRQLKRLMGLVDRAMGEEGIPSAVRDRVRARVIYGTPTPNEEPGDWAEPEERPAAEPDGVDRAVLEMLAEGPLAEPACLPPVNAIGW